MNCRADRHLLSAFISPVIFASGLPCACGGTVSFDPARGGTIRTAVPSTVIRAPLIESMPTKVGHRMTAETKSPASDSKTTGNAATSATAAPPAEKQTQIVSAIKQEKVEEVTNVNFNISIGTAVPSSVRYYPLSPRIVEIYPEWRGYDFILVRGKYIILRPHTHEIVYIIEG